MFLRSYVSAIDQKVIKFMNSEGCKSYDSLIDYLTTNQIPLREKWIFYFYGKNNTINEDGIISHSIIRHDFYGGFIDGEIHHWEKYLKDESDRKYQIRKEFEEKGQTYKLFEIDNLFIEEGFEFVKEMVDRDWENYIDQENYKAEKEYDRWANNRPFKNEESSYCGACLSSPCMCSDREKSSTVHDF
ncbi:MAG TPA: hypothetical protein VK590_08595 [Saprospiraceae bacterium]|nr:hypothetical protein [Saprospiraceae bacterium]